MKAELQAAGGRHVRGSDCVPHASNVVSVVPLLCSAINSLEAQVLT